MKGIDREKVLFALLILAALFIRIYRLDASLVEWHSLPVAGAARTLAQDHRMPLMGAQTIGTLGHYGPALEYFLAPFFLLSQSFSMFHLALVLTNIAAMYFLYRLGREFFSKEAGWLAAMLFGFSWFTLLSSRRGTNADFIPFFAVLLFYSLMQVISAGKRQYLILVGGCLGMLLQLYFSAFPALPAAVIILAVGYSRDKKKRRWLKPLAMCAAVLLLMFLPSMVFEYQNSFRETALRLKFVKGILMGGDSALQPQESIPARALRNVLGFFAFNPDYNPFGVDLDREYLCEPSLAGGGWTGIVYGAHWALTRLECAFALIAFVVMLCLALLGKNLPFSRAHISIVLLWFISGVTLLLVRPWDGNFHLTFAFAPAVLLISMFLSWIPGRGGRWRNALRVGTFSFCILLVFSSSILFLYATRKVAAESCVRGSFGDATLGLVADLQKKVLSEFGITPPIIFSRSLWGPQMTFNLVRMPEPSSVSNMAFLFLRNAELPPGDVLSEFAYSRDEGTLFGIRSFPHEFVHSSTYSEGWYLKGFDDSGWSIKKNDGMIAFSFEGNLCDGCGPLFDQGQLFLRFTLPVRPPADASLLLLQHGHNYGVEEVYANGALVYDKERPSTHGEGLLIDATESLVEGDNLFAVKIGEVEKLQALEPASLSIGAFLMMRNLGQASNDSNVPMYCNS